MKLQNNDIIAAYLGAQTISDINLGDNNVFSNYYGVSFPLEPQNTLMTRIGYMPWHKSLPIQSKMKTCTITSDGTVKYINASDRTKYEDGTDRDMTLNTMVEIPEFWYKCMKNDTDVFLNLYVNDPKLADVEHVTKFYISAYEATTVDDKLMSVNNGSTPTVSIPRTTMQSRARANGSEKWNMYTYKAHRILTILYLVEYACTNSQATYNATLTSEGYRQGGLGAGVTGAGQPVKNGSNIYSIVPCGTTDSLGNATGVVSFTWNNTNAEGATISTFNYNVPSYRGIENPFGHVWKNVIDVLVHFNSTDNCNDVMMNSNLATFGSTTIGDYTLQGQTSIKEGYKKQLIYNSAFDLFPSKTETFGANTTTYWCDYNYTNNSTPDRTFLLGGRVDIGGAAGLLAVRSSDGLGYSYAGVGTRLIYIP